MRKVFVLFAALLCLFLTRPADAQSVEEAMIRLEAAMVDAEAQAARPGDETLSCEALEAEMIAATQDPALQTLMVENGAWAQGQVDQMNAMAGRARAQMGMSMILGIASTFLPGAGYGQMLAQRAIEANNQAMMEQNMERMMQMAESMLPFLPQLFRGQRVHALGVERQCAFTQEAPPP
jgi:hypothetical protein